MSIIFRASFPLWSSRSPSLYSSFLPVRRTLDLKRSKINVFSNIIGSWPGHPVDDVLRVDGADGAGWFVYPYEWVAQYVKAEC